MTRRNGGEGIISTGIGQDAGCHRLAGISNAIAVHVLHQINGDIGEVGFADIVRAVAVGVIPHRAVDGGIQRRSGEIVKKVCIGERGQIGDVKR